MAELCSYNLQTYGLMNPLNFNFSKHSDDLNLNTQKFLSILMSWLVRHNSEVGDNDYIVCGLSIGN